MTTESNVHKTRLAIKILKKAFAELKNATRTAIETIGTSVRKLIDKIMDLPVDFEEHDELYLTEHSDDLRESKSVAAVFDRLRFHWDYLHPDLYAHLIAEFELSSVSPMLEAYQKDLSEFLDRMPLKEFCDVQKM